jgi:hypothetical protein
LADAIEPYRELLQRLLRGELSADEFQTSYFDVYLADESDCPYDVFQIVDGFFADVDSLVPRPRTPDPKFHEIDEETLRERAADLLRKAGYDPGDGGS